jgi:hypothetical protein
MCFLFSLLPATFWVVIGYFVLFSSSKTTVAGIRAFGQVLGIWIFVIAVLFLSGGAYVSIAGLCPDMSKMHSAMMSSPAQ